MKLDCPACGGEGVVRDRIPGGHEAEHVRGSERECAACGGSGRAACGVAGCDKPAEYVCASCDGIRCWEHSSYSPMADERFCALRPGRDERRTYCEEDAEVRARADAMDAWIGDKLRRERGETPRPCVRGCGRLRLDGHLTCGDVGCDESGARDERLR